MPIYLDPKGKFDLVLASDKGKTPEPSFRFRYLNGRKWAKLADIQDEVNKAAAEGAAGSYALGKIFDALRVGMCGWKDVTTEDAEVVTEFGIPAERIQVQAPSPVELPYKPELLDLILGPAEAKELLEGVVTHIRPTEDDRKNSESPLQ